MIQDYILLAALLAISFDIWNQIKSMIIQRELYSMSDKIDDFDTDEIRMKRVDDIYEEQNIEFLTTQNNAVGKIPENTAKISEKQLKSVDKIKTGLSKSQELYNKVEDYSNKMGLKNSLAEYNRQLSASNDDGDRKLSGIKQSLSEESINLDAVKLETQDLFEIIDTLKEYFSTDIRKTEDQLKDIQMRLTMDD
tara:strand:- start:2 stop:583 length:582 start_codon:yes stop_codon:yes gene_type:complete